MVAAEVIDGDGGLFRPISTETGASVSFSEVLYEQYRPAKTAAPSTAKSNVIARNASPTTKHADAAMIHGYCGGNRGEHRDDCEQGIDGNRRHRKPQPFRLQNISF